MTQEEQIRLYRLMEKLNWFFHQEMHYLNRDIAEKTARECYPEIRDFTYDILWNDLPKEVQEQFMDKEESLWLCKYHVPLWQQAALPPTGSVRKDGGHVGGRERLWAACSRQQGGRLYKDMADGLLELRGFYPPGDRPAAHGYLHRSEAQGTCVV